MTQQPKGNPTGFSIAAVEEDGAPRTVPAQTQAQSRAQEVSVKMMTLALAALSKKFIIAVANLFCLLTVASAFWLWYSIPEPNQHQLISLGMYGLFVLAINVIVNRRSANAGQ